MKKVEITDEIISAMSRAMSMDIEATNYTVFETIAVTSKPIQKKGTLFHKGVIVEATLNAMAALFDNGGFTVPVILDHSNYGEDSRPHGQLFTAKVYPRDDGFHELRALFAMPNADTDKNPKRAAITQDLDNGILSAVSVGVAFEKIVSAATGYDFLSFSSEGEASIYESRDDEGNIMGEDSFVLCLGVEHWREISLLREGASPDAGVKSAREQRLAEEFSDSRMFKRLAASGYTTDQSVLFATCETVSKKKPQKQKENYAMDKELIAQLAAKGEEVGTLKATAIADKATIASLTAERDTANAALATANTDLEAAKTAKTELEAELAAVKAEAKAGTQAEVEAVTKFVDDNFTAAVAASGKKDVKIEGLVGKLAFIEETGVKLHQIVGAGQGKSKTGKVGEFSAAESALLNANHKGR